MLQTRPRRCPLSASAFWKPWEKTASSFNDVRDIIQDIFDTWSAEGRTFAWRGQVNADWGLHSSLYRRLFLTLGTPPAEATLYEKEDEVLKRVHQWGLHHASAGRLLILYQLAMLQHYGAPTRLVDCTFNPYIGLWFAVEEKWSNAQVQYANDDARLFAVDVTGRLINEADSTRSWEDDFARPWRPSKLPRADWSSEVYVWRPSSSERRISAQHGGFLLGGVPASNATRQRQWRKATAPNAGYWPIADVRGAVSLPLRVHLLNAGPGKPATNPVYTIRIDAKAKADIRTRLENLYGYRHSTMYPDFTGFSAFATPELRSR